MSARIGALTAMKSEFAFTLPRGVVDEGRVHRPRARHAAGDGPRRDRPAASVGVRQNEAYLTVLLLARTVTHLGDVTSITPAVVENLFTPDLAFLQDLYQRINSEGHTTASVTCPSCHEEFAVDLAGGPREILTYATG